MTIKRRLLLVSGLIVFVGLAFFAGSGVGWISAQISSDEFVNDQGMMVGVIWSLLLLYIVLIAIPFVPGVEIGIGLFVFLGAQMAPLIYLSTLTGLSLAFFAGRLVPMVRMEQFFSLLTLKRAAGLCAQLAPLSREERIELISQNAPARWLPFVLRNRYLALAIAVNVPGNGLIGGGGGISMMAGLSGLFSYPAFILTLAIAVAPVPIMVFFFGPNWQLF